MKKLAIISDRLKKLKLDYSSLSITLEFDDTNKWKLAKIFKKIVNYFSFKIEEKNINVEEQDLCCMNCGNFDQNYLRF
jgi:hypothetical protein